MSVLLVLALPFLVGYAVLAQADYIVALANIPSFDLDISPAPAFTSGVAECTRSTVVALATADAQCPNGVWAVNQASISGAIGGPELYEAGITFVLLSGKPIHQEFTWASCANIPDRHFEGSAYQNCNELGFGLPQIGMSSCTTPGINGSCPPGRSMNP